jgi:AhpD family alkylhydroperoxidase
MESDLRDHSAEEHMKTRLNIGAVSPAAYRAMLGLEKFIQESSVEPKLAHLLKMRASQLNGCAYCLDMHSKDARALGETEQRLYGLDAWREAPYYTDRERAALEWIEALTLISEGHVPDEVYERARQQFSEKELVDLAIVAVAINGWNRLAIAFRAEPGSYQPQKLVQHRTSPSAGS